VRTVVILTRMPSPYQARLFDLLAADGRIALRVIYERMTDADRDWRAPTLAHEHASCRDAPFAHLEQWVRDSDLCVFGGYRDPFLRRLLTLRFAARRPFVFWGERFGYQTPLVVGAIYRRWAMRAFHATRSEMWGVGEMAVASYRREFGPRRRYRNIPYSSDLSGFLSIARDDAEGRLPRLLFSGSLIARKGVDLLVAALERALADGVAIAATFVGDGPLRPQVERLARSHPNRVAHVGFTQMDALPDVYARADVLVAPSRHDGWGLVVIEGMAAAMPVLASDRTGAAVERVTAETGWLIPAGDAAALERTLREIARTPIARLRAMGAVARARSRDDRVEAGRDRMIEAIERCLAERS
jgi:glycosyltransferase involved in cell wall biosynthesis